LLISQLFTSSIHQHTFRGPVAYWSTVGKTYTLDVLKMVYEAHVSREMLTNSWIICFREGNEINPENLKKTRKYEKNEKIKVFINKTISYERILWIRTIVRS